MNTKQPEAWDWRREALGYFNSRETVFLRFCERMAAYERAQGAKEERKRFEEEGAKLLEECNSLR